MGNKTISVGQITLIDETDERLVTFKLIANKTTIQTKSKDGYNPDYTAEGGEVTITPVLCFGNQDYGHLLEREVTADEPQYNNPVASDDSTYPIKYKFVGVTGSYAGDEKGCYTLCNNLGGTEAPYNTNVLKIQATIPGGTLTDPITNITVAQNLVADIEFTKLDSEEGVGVLEINQLYLQNTPGPNGPTKPLPPASSSDVYDEEGSSPRWIRKQPIWADGTDLWLCSEIRYSNNVYSYTDPYADQTWRATAKAVENFTAQLEDIKNQLDGVVDTWYAPQGPEVEGFVNPWLKDLNNPTEEEIEQLNKEHVGDIFVDTTTNKTYRYVYEKKNDTDEAQQYFWKEASSQETSYLVEMINSVKDEVDKRVRVFYVSVPSGETPQDNDLLIGENGNLYKYVSSAEEGERWQVVSVAIRKTEIQFATHDSSTTAPETGWSSVSPTWANNQYVWQRIAYWFSQDTTSTTPDDISDPVCISAAAARLMTVVGEQAMVAPDGINYSSITLTALPGGGLTVGGWQYKTSDPNVADGWETITGSSQQTTLTVDSKHVAFEGGKEATFKVFAKDAPEFYDIISVYKIEGAINAYLMNEFITFCADENGKTHSKETFVLPIVVYKGGVKCLYDRSYSKSPSFSGVPNGMNIQVFGTNQGSKLALLVTVEEGANLGSNLSTNGIVNVSWEVEQGSPLSLSFTWNKINDAPSSKSVEIISTDGRKIFTNSNSENIELKAEYFSGGNIITEGISYSWDAIPSQVAGVQFSEQDQSISISRDQIPGARTFICNAQGSSGSGLPQRTAYFTLEDKTDQFWCNIKSSNGDKFTNHNINTALECQVWSNAGQHNKQEYTYTWKKYSEDGSEDTSWPNSGTNQKTLSITASDVDKRAIFECTVEEGSKFIATGIYVVLDFVDTATYIYYADDNGSTNISKDPKSTSAYIGIYNGEALPGGQPEPSTEQDSDYAKIQSKIYWTGYVGPQGLGLKKINTYIRKFPYALPSDIKDENGKPYRYGWTTAKEGSSTAFVDAGHTETWTSTNFDNSHIKVGDTAYLEGIVADRWSANDQQQTITLYGIVTNVASAGVTMTTSHVIWGGEKGETGETGEKGDSVVISPPRYQLTNNNQCPEDDDADWDDSKPEPVPGKYLWTQNRFEVAGTTSYSYTCTYIGKNSEEYRIELDYDEILAFWDGEETKYDFSPASFSVWVKNLAENQKITIDGTTKKLTLTSPDGESLDFTSSSDTIFEFDFDDFNDSCKEKDSNFNAEAKMNTWLDGTGLFVLTYSLNGQVQATAPVYFRRGLDSEMAKFNATATNINAAVRDAYMEFNANGLTIRTQPDGKATGIGLQILNNAGDQVFYADDEGDLVLSGTVTATGGEIGGFLLESSTLKSVEGNLTIDGKTGTISGGSISLSTSATLESVINLGENTYLCNPDSNNGLVLKSGAISIKSTGVIDLGDICLDASNSENPLMYGGKKENPFWKITKDLASFSNANISGTINTSVFNVGTTQAVGSTMLFAPSFKVSGFWPNEENTYLIELQEAHAGDLKENAIIWLVDENNYVQAKVVGLPEGNQIVAEPMEEFSGDAFDPTLIVSIGSLGSSSLVFGVNSGNSRAAKDSICSQSLTITEMGADGNLKDTPRLVLGNLQGVGHTGYGLYSDNVFLNGSLTTKVEGGGYAGVNTQNSTTETSGSPIVFWAGANDETTIGDANFKVTASGVVSAKQAVFQDSIFTNGIIEGTTLKTATIVGIGTNPALILKDTEGGIAFCSKEGNTTMRIDSRAISFSNKNVIQLTNQKISIIGDAIKIKGDNSTHLGLECVDNNTLALEHSNGFGLHFSENMVALKAGRQEGADMLTATGAGITVFGNVIFSDKTTVFQYRPVTKGYDLFISAEGQEE